MGEMVADFVGGAAITLGLALLLCIAGGILVSYLLSRIAGIRTDPSWAPLLGLLAAPVAYSLVAAHGPTMSYGIVGTLAIWLVLERLVAPTPLSPPPALVVEWRRIAVFVGFALFGFGWAVATNFAWYSEGPLPLGLDTDLAYYALVTESLGQTGVETYYPDTLTGQVGFVPYHFIELWLGVLLHRATGLGTYAVQQLVVAPLQVAGVAFAGYQLARAVGGRARQYAIWVGLAALVLGQFDWTLVWPNDFTRGTNYFFVNPLGLHGTAFKLRPLLIVCLGALALWLRGHKRSAAVWMLALPFFNPATALAVYGAALLLLAWAWLSTRARVASSYKLRLDWPLTLVFGASFAGYAALTLLADHEAGRSIVLPDFTNPKHLITLVNIAGKTTLQMLATYLLLIALAWRYRAQLQPLLWPIVAVYVAGLGAWMLLFQLRDSVQLFSVVPKVAAVALFVWLVCLLLNEATRLSRWMLWGVLSLSVVTAGIQLNKYYMRALASQDAAFVRAALSHTPKRNDQRGLYFYPRWMLQRYDIYMSHELNHPLAELYWVHEPMAFALANPSAITNTCPCYPPDTFFRDRAHLMRFRRQHGITSDSAAWMPFIREQRINYLVTSGRENLHYLDRFDIESRIVSADSNLAIAWLRKSPVRP
jgi:hypothetical protein